MTINKKHLEAARLLEGALQGDIRAANKFAESLQYGLKEGISTSDLPTALAPTLSRLALNDYAEQEKIWSNWASREVLPDFESQEYYSLSPWGDEDVEPSTAGDTFYSGGLPTVPEYGEYSRLRFEATAKSLRLKKGGVAVQFSWESLLNPRNIGRIPRAFAEFGRRAAVKEDHEATKPLLNFTENFIAGNGNVLAGAPALSIESIQAALEAVTNQTYNGRRVTAPARYALVVPQSLEATARSIQAIESIETVTTSGGVETRMRTGNPVAGKFETVVNPYLTQLGGTDTGWYLIPAPGSTPNPSVVNLFLQGHEAPQIFVKRTTNADPTEGSFENDDYETKVRHVVTGAFIEPAGTMYSAGTA